MLFDIPLVIVISFLLSTAVIVLYSIKKFTTFRVYAVGNRQFSTVSLIATTLATYYGGSIFIAYLSRFSLGPFWISKALLSVFIPFLILSWLSMRMSKFIYHISMPETMGRIYGKYPRLITALLSICISTTVVAVQVNIVSQVISRCIHSVSPVWITILTTLMLVAYTIFGGIRAVVLTDLWQLVIFIGVICFLVWFFLFKKSFSISEILGFATTQKQFAWSELLFGKNKLIYALHYLSIIFFFIEPGYMQHMYMSAVPAQAKKVFLYAGILGFFITLCCILAGPCLSVWLPADLPRAQILNYIMAHASPLFKGIFCICLLALAMSTADSRLHICAVMISHDILPLLRVRLAKNISCSDHYRVAYISILVIAVLAIFLSLHSSYLTIVRRMTNSLHRFYVPIIVAPFILAVLGFRTTSPAALIGMATGALVVIVWPKWVYPLLRTNTNDFPCVLINGLTMLAVHYLWPRSRKFLCSGMLLLRKTIKKHHCLKDLD